MKTRIVLTALTLLTTLPALAQTQTGQPYVPYLDCGIEGMMHSRAFTLSNDLKITSTSRRGVKASPVTLTPGEVETTITTRVKDRPDQVTSTKKNVLVLTEASGLLEITIDIASLTEVGNYSYVHATVTLGAETAQMGGEAWVMDQLNCNASQEFVDTYLR